MLGGRNKLLALSQYYTILYCMKFLNKIYNVPMKFARKLIHGGPVHPCYEVKALQQGMETKKK